MLKDYKEKEDVRMMTAIVYSPMFLNHKHFGHPERPERLIAIIDFLKEMPFFDELNKREPSPIDEEAILEIHSKEMIEKIRNATHWLDPDTYAGDESYKTAKLAAGGLVDVCNDVILGKEKNAFALVRPPGHHATRSKSMGFCLINNAALAAHALTKRGKKVLIFDHDVHHGNGTCDIFYDRSDVMYQSIHLYPHYPGTGMIEEVGRGDGEGYTINAPLSHLVGDRGVGKILDKVFIPIAQQFSPDMILISAGFDSHYADPLGGLALSINFFGNLIEKLLDIQEKMVCTLEGGYNVDVLKKGVASEVGVMNGTPIKFDDCSKEMSSAEEVIKQLNMTFRDYWNL